MKEIGVLFKAEMVRGILADIKIQTRRVMKVQPPDNSYKLAQLIGSTNIKDRRHEGKLHWIKRDGLKILETGDRYFQCPYAPGDLLYVKETFCYPGEAGYPLYRADMPMHWDAKDTEHDEDVDLIASDYKWTSSLFMPKMAARIWLEVIMHRGERVQDISEADAISEGVEYMYPDSTFPYKDYQLKTLDGCDTAKKSFKSLWDYINERPKIQKRNPYTGGKEICYVSYPWEDVRAEERHKGKVHYVIGNPWVWVPEFKRIER